MNEDSNSACCASVCVHEPFARRCKQQMYDCEKCALCLHRCRLRRRCRPSHCRCRYRTNKVYVCVCVIVSENILPTAICSIQRCAHLYCVCARMVIVLYTVVVLHTTFIIHFLLNFFSLSLAPSRTLIYFHSFVHLLVLLVCF